MKKQILCCSLSLLILSSSCYGMQERWQNIKTKLSGCLQSTKEVLKDNAVPIAVWATTITLSLAPEAIRIKRGLAASDDASDETTQLVRNIQQQMGMGSWNIRVKRQSDIENCAAFPFFNSMILDEGWLNRFSGQEKRFIIGHELAHLKNRDFYKNISASFVTSMLLSWITRAAMRRWKPRSPTVRRGVNISMTYWCSRLGFRLSSWALSRSCEYAADTTASRTLGTAGGIALLSHLKEKLEELGPSYVSDPPLAARIANLERLQS